MSMTLDDLAHRIAELQLTLPGTTKVLLPGSNNSGDKEICLVELHVVGTLLIKRTESSKDEVRIKQCEAQEAADQQAQEDQEYEEAILLLREQDE
jgi:hypothetical protein